MAIAYSYIRFSTRKQADGDSLRRQSRLALEYCKANDLELSEQSFKDLGVSALHSANANEDKGLGQFLSALQQGVIPKGSFLLVESLDRLSRAKVMIALRQFLHIIEYDITVVTLIDGRKYNSESDTSDLIISLTVMERAHNESITKSKRILAIKATQRKLVREGKVVNKRLPFWITNSDGYQLNDKAQIVRDIIKQRTSGVGFHRIAMNLNGVYEAPKAKHWSDTTIRDIVKSRALYGSMVDKDGEVESVFPALIDFTEWQAIQSEHVSSAGGYTKHNHLARLVKCECGAAMSKKIQKSKTKTKTHEYNTWKCVAATSGGCEHKGVIRDLDVDIFKSLNHLKINKTKSDTQLNKISKQIEKKSVRQQELEQALLEDDAPIAALTKAIKKTTEELKQLRSERDLLSVRTDSKLLIELQDNAVEFNIELRKLVEKIVVTPISSNRFQIKIHQHNGHIVNCLKGRKSQRSEWTRLFGKTEEMLRIATEDDGMPYVDWAETDEL
ncbi:recombinase family protein [Vibrio vulnificus]|nr:recombinase family protein [Vibrio vulnificus]HAS8316612.1 recombinase family protein [Vibrio vulnificus]HAS8460814.1 recombinase family protein [Vibrio vulnificus]